MNGVLAPHKTWFRHLGPAIASEYEELNTKSIVSSNSSLLISTHLEPAVV